MPAKLKDRKCPKCRGPLFPEIHDPNLFLTHSDYSLRRNGVFTCEHALDCGLIEQHEEDWDRGFKNYICICGQKLWGMSDVFRHLRESHPWRKLITRQALENF